MMKFLKTVPVLSFVLCAFYSLSSQAAIIYIDVNNNIEERSTYVNELAKEGNHQSFTTIPQIELPSAQLLTQLGRQRDSIWVNYVKQGCVQDFAWQPVSGSQCQEIQKTLWAIETRIRNIPKTNITADVVRSALRNVHLDPNESITLVISGHFGGGVFTGNLGSMSVEDMGRVFNEFPAIQKQIVRMHLLGCYTNVFSQVTSLWRTAFPYARVLAGFYERSPAGDDPRNLSFIRFIVRNTKAIDKVKSEGQFQTVMRALKPYGAIHAALSVDNMYRETGDELMFVNETSIPLSRCKARLTAGDRDYFAKVFKGEIALPTDTDGSRLRHYYSALRDNALCLDEPQFTKTQLEIPTADLAMRLLFFKNVIINFRNLYRGQVAHFDQLLGALGINPALNLQNIDLSRRAAIVSWSTDLSVALATSQNRPETAEANKLLNGFKAILVDLDPSCVPVNWVEPSAFMSSACLAQ